MVHGHEWPWVSVALGVDVVQGTKGEQNGRSASRRCQCDADVASLGSRVVVATAVVIVGNLAGAECYRERHLDDDMFDERYESVSCRVAKCGHKRITDCSSSVHVEWRGGGGGNRVTKNLHTSTPKQSETLRTDSYEKQCTFSFIPLLPNQYSVHSVSSHSYPISTVNLTRNNTSTQITITK